MRRVEAFRWLYFDSSTKALRLTRNHMTREEAALRLPDAKPDLKTREVRYVKEGAEDLLWGLLNMREFLLNH